MTGRVGTVLAVLISGALAASACVSSQESLGRPDGSAGAAAGAAGSTAGSAGTTGASGSGGEASGGQAGGLAGAAAGASGAAGTSVDAGAAGATAGSGGAKADAGTAGVTGQGGTAGTPPPWDDELRKRAAAGMVPLQVWYDQGTGLWNKTDWWTSANQLETVIDYTRETGDPTYFADIDNTFVKNQAGKFDKFGFYDDDGWWAIAWIKAYDLTHDAKYLDMAKTIFTRMAGGWDAKCGGGIYWASAKNSSDGLKNKNAIPNSLFLQVAAKLHQRTPGDAGAGSYLDWAQREWAWFKGTGMLTAKHLVIDSLDGLTTCKPVGPQFTYNVGVLLGGLVDLSLASGDATLMDEARAIAQATMTTMVDGSGILKEAPCGGDICTQFKGVFMRNLALLYRTKPVADERAFSIKQSDRLWTSNTKNAMNQFGYEWIVPFDKATASRQSSALDALVAAVMTGNLNLALGGKATGDAPCGAAEGAANAIDGNGRSTKWCAGGAGGQTLTVDLGAARSIVGFRVRHAGGGGESPGWNTRDFELETSADGQAWARAATVTGNTADVTTHPTFSTTARYARLHVTTAGTATDISAARIYELEIFGTSL
jgi:predicted alpha-1,6-mannanase (GH76 family)